MNVPTYHWVSGDWVAIDATSSSPPAAPPPPPGMDACRLLSELEVVNFLGSPVTRPATGPPTYTNGPVGPLHNSTCSFGSEKTPPSNANPPGLVDSVTVVHESAPSPEAAERHYQALVEAFGRQSPRRGVQGVGDEAAAFEGVVVARRGSDVMQVQVSANDKTLVAGVEDLALVAAARLWP